jgi:hypothetical protein
LPPNGYPKPPLVFKMASEQECWRATRLGLTPFTAGKGAVRQRIKDRTGL